MQGVPQMPPQGMAKPPPQQGSEPEVIRNIMVNYIPTTIDEIQLRQLFEMYGPVESVKIVTDRDTRSSKGYGFVKYRFGFSAGHAIQYLNGYPLMNKRLKVAYSNQAEAAKFLNPPAAENHQFVQYNQHPSGGQMPQQLDEQAWTQQMNYMQHLAAMQMMQAQAQAGAYGMPPVQQQHAHAQAMQMQRHHHHHAAQQPQQPQSATEHHQQHLAQQ